MRKIYLASSWRNTFFDLTLDTLRAGGHDVFNFKNPRSGENGFHWSEIDPAWKQWSPAQFVEVLESHPLAARGFESDMGGMIGADTLVLVMPCGRSAHLECGWAVGRGIPTAIYYPTADGFEPELMQKMVSARFTTDHGLLKWLDGLGA